MQYIRFVFILFFLAVSGCDGTGQNDTEFVTIDDFYVVGTNNNSRYETPEVNPYINDGEFTVFLRPGKPALGYELNLYLASRASGDDAVLLYHLVCDDDDAYCYDPEYLVVSCAMNTDLNGFCDYDGFSLQDWIPRLPYSAYLMAELCHRVQNECVTSGQRLVLL